MEQQQTENDDLFHVFVRHVTFGGEVSDVRKRGQILDRGILSMRGFIFLSSAVVSFLPVSPM